jgi:hypothetical protein
MDAAKKRTAYAIGLLLLLATFVALEVLRYWEVSPIDADLHPIAAIGRIVFALGVTWFWWRDRNTTSKSPDSTDVWFLAFLVALAYR